MNTERAPDWLPTYLVPFVTLSNPVPRPENPDAFPNSDFYLPSLLDGCFIITCIAIMAVLRDFFRVFVMEPFAQWYLTREQRKARGRSISPKLVNGDRMNGAAANGNGHVVTEKTALLRIKRKDEKAIRHKVLRFAEQSWSLIYYTVQWGYGVYVHYNLPTAPFNPAQVWVNYPHLPLAGPLKFYYLTQTAFYMHQVLILNAEARRKDHWQMMSHHVITIALMILSYFYNFTRVGCLIMVLMDTCDVVFPAAKMLRYLDFVKACDAAFVLFMSSWFITRHVLFIIVMKSAYFDSFKYMPFDWDPSRDYYFTREVYIAFIAMLVALQAIQIVWFGMICRVAYRVVTGQGAEDTRSDEEEDSEDVEVAPSPVTKDSPLKKRR